MDKSCEEPIRSVKLKGDNLTVHVNDCNKCASCQKHKDDIKIIKIVESEKDVKKAYTRWIKKRENPNREIILLD